LRRRSADEARAPGDRGRGRVATVPLRTTTTKAKAYEGKGEGWEEEKRVGMRNHDTGAVVPFETGIRSGTATTRRASRPLLPDRIQRSAVSVLKRRRRPKRFSISK